MVAGNATVRWRCVSGVRFAAGDPTALSVDLSAWPHPDEGAITQVTFSIVVNGGSPTSVVVNSPSLRQPNYSPRTSPLPGVTSGFAKIWGYGTTLDLSTIGFGTVEVTASVRSHLSGTDYDTPASSSFVIYNDTDGTDRRPCSSVMYVSTTGDNANAGTIGSPKATITGALNGLVAAAGADLRGGRIVLLAGDHSMGGQYGASSWHTSGAGWLDIEFQAGATISRVYDSGGGTVFPDSYLMATGNGAGAACRLRMVNPRIRGSGFAPFVADGAGMCVVWMDGGSSGSWADNESNLSARFIDYDGDPAGFDGPGAANSYWIATQHTRGGVTDGFSGARSIHDCRVTRFLGIGLYDNAPVAMDVCNVLLDEQDYIYPNAESQVLGLIEYEGGADLTITDQKSGPHSGFMRIEMSGGSPPFDIFAHGAELVGSLRVGLVVTGADSAANNGTFSVLEAGADYLVLDNPTPVSEVGGSAFKLTTGRLSDGTTWNVWIHPNAWRTQGDRTGSVVQNLAVSPTVRSAQGLFTSAVGNTMTRCVWDEVVVPPALRGNFDLTTFQDCTFRYCTVAGAWDWGGSTAPGSVCHDCVAGSANNWPTATAQVTNRIHRITGGSVGGTNPTSGSWFADDPNTSYLPAVGVRGLDSGLGARPPAAKWSGDTAWSQGCGAWPVGQLNWAPPVEEVTGSLDATFTLSLAATAEVEVEASLAASFDLALSAAAELEVEGALDATFDLALTAAATIESAVVVPTPAPTPIPTMPNRRTPKYPPRDPPVRDRWFRGEQPRPWRG
ncbi:MAG: hypothetical protein JNK15_23740 [Planctomycetes bacterium]|nr:hypothetical protein [Planctomycetota bacterium]